MAKFQKMDPKQVPQVIVLGVLTVGVLGYGVMQAMGTGGEKKPAATAASASDDSEKTESAATGTSSDVQITQAGAPAMQLPGTFNPDPFRPIKGAKSTLPPVDVAPTPPPVRKPIRTASALRWPGGDYQSIPSLGTGGGVPAKPAVVVPAPPPAPIRPTMLVTGIIDVEDGDDMALIVIDGGDRRILQVGDVVANNYRVKKIAMDGVMLVNGTDKYFVSIGKKDESASAAPAPAAGVVPQG